MTAAPPNLWTEALQPITLRETVYAFNPALLLVPEFFEQGAYRRLPDDVIAQGHELGRQLLATRQRGVARSAPLIVLGITRSETAREDTPVLVTCMLARPWSTGINNIQGPIFSYILRGLLEQETTIYMATATRRPPRTWKHTAVLHAGNSSDTTFDFLSAYEQLMLQASQAEPNPRGRVLRTAARGAKTAGKKVPYLGQVLMAVDAAPVAYEEGKHLASTYVQSMAERVRRGHETAEQVGEALQHGRVGQATKEVALETARQYGEGLKFSGETAVSAAKIGYAALAGRERRKKKSRKKKSRQRRARTKKS